MQRIQFLTAGESHGPGLTGILTGMPAGLVIDMGFIQDELQRRQHGYGRGRRMQIESDEVEFRGGLRGSETLGSPISFWIGNRDHDNWAGVMDPIHTDPKKSAQRRLHSPRPGHADLAGGIKYQRQDLRDVLERASARESVARVAAGAIAQLLLREFQIEIKSGVRYLGSVGVERPIPTWHEIQAMDDSSPLRALYPDLEEEMVRQVDQAKKDGETLGGAVTVIAHNVPVGLGSHVQWNEKLDGLLAQAVMSVPAVKAVEIGSAMRSSQELGSRAHDPIFHSSAKGWERPSNHAGGLEGGITNGQDLVITAIKKPISTLREGLPSVDLDTLQPARGQYERSDVTALPAAGVIAEAMVALLLADALLLEKVGGDSMQEVMTHYAGTLSIGDVILTSSLNGDRLFMAAKMVHPRSVPFWRKWITWRAVYQENQARRRPPWRATATKLVEAPVPRSKISRPQTKRQDRPHGALECLDKPHPDDPAGRISWRIKPIAVNTLISEPEQLGRSDRRLDTQISDISEQLAASRHPVCRTAAAMPLTQHHTRGT